jgi:putative ABC transport system ATP-binding protein
MEALRLQSVDKTYRLGKTAVHALHDVTLQADRGQFVTVVGPSGSGKSTLLNIIGLIDRPSSGFLSLFGEDLTDAGEKSLTQHRAAHIGFIFQSFNLIPTLNVRENVAYPLNRTPLSLREQRTMASEMLEAVGLAGYHKRFPNDLSGGERQRVAIARALVKSPSVVLADEPTANLDSGTGKTIVNLLHHMKERSRALVVLSTHDPEIISRSDAVYHLRDGRLSRDGKAEA